MLVRVIYTVISFTFLFFLLTLVLGFWGRQILGLFRIRKAGWGEPLTLAAGLGLAVFLAQAASPLVSNFRNLWQAFYFIGLFGALAEAVRFYVRDVRLKEKRLKFLRQEAGRLHTLWASLILAAVLSFAYSVIWPSGRLDIWADTSADFYSWIFASEYLAGGIKANVLDLNPSFQYTLQDAFGTLNIIGFASQAYQRTPLLGSSHVLVTLLVWWGTAVFVLVRKCFGLRFRLSLLLALGLILGWLPNYLSAFGMFGHLAAMTALVTALEQLIPEHKDDWPGPKLIRRLFFPLLVLFLSYQSGYLPGILVLILFGSLQAFGQAGSRSPAARTGRALLQGIRPILWLTLALALIMPGSFYHLTARLLENSARISGWILPLFSPRIFSGLPYYPRDFYYHTHITETNQISFYFYIPFILIIFFLLYLLLKTKKQPAGQASPAVQPEAGPVPVPVPAPAPDLISAARDNFPAGQEKSPGPPKSAESPQDNKDRPAGSGPAGSGSADSGPADQKDSPAPAEEAGGLQPAAAASLTAVFIFSLLVYLGAFLAFGHVYKVWKLAAYTALPLSFLPLTLVFALLVKHLGRRPRLIRGIALTLAAAFLVQFASVKAADIPGQYFGMVSARSLVRTLRQISSDISRGSTVIVSMDSWSRNLIASIIFANNQSFKAKFTRTLFHIQPAPIDYNLLTQKTYILSDVDYKDIIRGRFESYISGRFFVYNFSRLQIQGYLALPGNELQEDRFKRYSAFNWKLGPSPVYGNMIIPRDKIGRDLTFQAEFNGPPQLPENCRRLRLGWFREGRELIWQSGQGPHFKAAVPAQDSRKGLMKFILEFDPAFQPPNPSPAEASCSYDIVNFTVK